MFKNRSDKQAGKCTSYKLSRETYILHCVYDLCINANPYHFDTVNQASSKPWRMLDASTLIINFVTRVLFQFEASSVGTQDGKKIPVILLRTLCTVYGFVRAYYIT